MSEPNFSLVWITSKEEREIFDIRLNIRLGNEDRNQTFRWQSGWLMK